jgi:hypothetical protein
VVDNGPLFQNYISVHFWHNFPVKFALTHENSSVLSINHKVNPQQHRQQPCQHTSRHAINPILVAPLVMVGSSYRRAFGTINLSAEQRRGKPDTPKPEEICPGSIVWLLSKDQAGPVDLYCVREGHCGPDLLKTERYRHPAVVLSIRQRPGSTEEGDLMVRISDVSYWFPVFEAEKSDLPHQMTTFNGCTLENYAKHQDRLIKFRTSIPIKFEEGSTVQVPQLELSPESKSTAFQTFLSRLRACGRTEWHKYRWNSTQIRSNWWNCIEANMAKVLWCAWYAEG